MSTTSFTRLLHEQGNLSSKKVTAGFDGFVDSVSRVIKKKNGEGPHEYFKTSREFGEYTSAKDSKNFSLELDEQFTKLGGNMPILANALGTLGIHVHCVGALGWPDVQSEFLKMHSNCSLHTFSTPGTSNALEFDESKIILNNPGGLKHANWRVLKKAIGPDRLNELYSSRDLICMVNWSELDHATEIWSGIYHEVLRNVGRKGDDTVVFFDLSDCSPRSKGQINEILTLIKSFSAWGNAVLGLNLNEASLVSNALSGKSFSSIRKTGEEIYKRLNLHCVVIHDKSVAMCWNGDEVFAKDSYYLNAPKLLTGAGDNFNAGFCAGLLLDLDMDVTLALAHGTSHFYMKYGHSPTFSELLSLLDEVG